MNAKQETPGGTPAKCVRAQPGPRAEDITSSKGKVEGRRHCRVERRRGGGDTRSGGGRAAGVPEGVVGWAARKR